MHQTKRYTWTAVLEKTRSAILIPTELLCLSLRRSHRSHDLPTRLLSSVSAVPTEATTYVLTSFFAPVPTPSTDTTAHRPLPDHFHHDVASAYRHIISTPFTALTETSANPEKCGEYRCVHLKTLKQSTLKQSKQLTRKVESAFAK